MSLKIKYPEIASEWHPTLNGDIKPEQISFGSARMVWWLCKLCNHSYTSSPNTRTNMNAGCPYCKNKKLCDSEECELCFEKSFASHEKVKYWSSKNKENPRYLFKYTNKLLFYFNCEECKSELTISLNNVSSGKWCRKCGYKSMIEKQSMKIDDFIQKGKEKFGETYDYSKVILNGIDRSIILICKKHNIEFTTTPYRHYTSITGCCPKCSLTQRSESTKYTFDEFYDMAISIHKDKYDYSLSKEKYINMKSEIPIICKVHGIYNQCPTQHLIAKYGCEKCAKTDISSKQCLSLEEFIERSNIKHNNKYDYSNTKYINSKTIVCVICKIHGNFNILPFNHLKGHGCKKCNGISVSNLEDFIERANIIHNNKYDYSKSIYNKSIENIIIICKKHGI